MTSSLHSFEAKLEEILGWCGTLILCLSHAAFEQKEDEKMPEFSESQLSSFLKDVISSLEYEITKLAVLTKEHIPETNLNQSVEGVVSAFESLVVVCTRLLVHHNCGKTVTSVEKNGENEVQVVQSDAIIVYHMYRDAMIKNVHTLYLSITGLISALKVEYLSKKRKEKEQAIPVLVGIVGNSLKSLSVFPMQIGEHYSNLLQDWSGKLVDAMEEYKPVQKRLLVGGGEEEDEEGEEDLDSEMAYLEDFLGNSNIYESGEEGEKNENENAIALTLQTHSRIISLISCCNTLLKRISILVKLPHGKMVMVENSTNSDNVNVNLDLVVSWAAQLSEKIDSLVIDATPYSSMHYVDRTNCIHSYNGIIEHVAIKFLEILVLNQESESDKWKISLLTADSIPQFHRGGEVFGLSDKCMWKSVFKAMHEIRCSSSGLE